MNYVERLISDSLHKLFKLRVNEEGFEEVMRRWREEHVGRVWQHFFQAMLRFVQSKLVIFEATSSDSPPSQPLESTTPPTQPIDSFIVESINEHDGGEMRQLLEANQRLRDTDEKLEREILVATSRVAKLQFYLSLLKEGKKNKRLSKDISEYLIA
eukprot:CAMPEP_0168622200 /NCGR_PEP_ID=MMETSP0449_2-20121227/8133_1 /TAXON_ID=1082188 /ORGANISM="Strombidium rassoulzadegani, Strain ras09" /LENGTH=155 /DNA_ID=CAMNT_0008663435 /DNA_START=17 /DNA_END=484 /DNA_ORIENTATION=-